MDEEIKSNWVKRTFKVLGIIAAILFVVVVVAFPVASEHVEIRAVDLGHLRDEWGLAVTRRPSSTRGQQPRDRDRGDR